MRDWKKWPINQINVDDERFPEYLKSIKTCPKKLFFRGNWNSNIFEKTIGVVGSRRITRYGRDVIAKFVPTFVGNKITIISGFMYGVDSEAHKTCVENGGKTIAVLGGGLDYIYPPENDNLYSLILENGGLVLSEYEADFKPTLWSFPQRNRIVSALSTIGILVIEAGLNSGSLITAKIAKKQGKKIFSIPGQINSSTSTGTNWLIKNYNGILVSSPGDILESSFKINATQIDLFEPDLSEIERKIIGLLKSEELSVDELSIKLNLAIADISINLSMLSMKNLIEEEAGKVYLKN